MFVSGGSPLPIAPSTTATAFTFLVPQTTSSNEAWCIASAGRDNNGATVIQLVNSLGMPLSDPLETFSSAPTRLKFQNVQISPSDSFPLEISVRVTNRSTTSNSSAYVEGVLIL